MEWLRALVRPVVTFAMVAIFGYGLLRGLIPWEAAAPIITMVIVFWFEEKAVERTLQNLMKE